jgi:hypothetical protein
MQYAPLTASERWRLYFISAYGPGAIAQWNDTPKEWKQGSEAFGERFGDSFCQARHPQDARRQGCGLPLDGDGLQEANEAGALACYAPFRPSHCAMAFGKNIHAARW